MLTRRQLIATGTGLLLAGAATPAVGQEATELQINSARYISTNADTGAIFAQRGAHDQVAIASLTKVFTAMEAINLAPLGTQIQTTSDDLQSADATTMGFGPGETFSLEELIYGMMLPSGNDAAHAIARHLGYQDGDTAEEAVQRFMDMVNQRVQAMGLQNTHLVNPDGWGVPDHYSSAADVAAYMAYASTSDFLMTVMGTPRFTTSSGYVLVNSNKVLTSSPSVVGGKTGYDWDSGWCLVQLAQRDNTRIIAVTLDGIAPDDWYNDNLVLLDFGFDQQKALGNKAFDGEFVAWQDPAPTLFADAGVGEVAIAGETESNDVVITREEPVKVPERVQQETPAVSEPDPIAFSGRHGSGVLAGVGAGVLAGAIGIRRWVDFGGDRSAESIRDGLGAITGSIRHIVPTPVRKATTESDDPTLFKDEDTYLDDLSSEAPSRDDGLPDFYVETESLENPDSRGDGPI